MERESKSGIVLIFGIPGSGKSTLARKILTSTQGVDFICIDIDEIEQLCRNQFSNETCKQLLETYSPNASMHPVITRFIDSLITQLEHNRSLTHSPKSSGNLQYSKEQPELTKQQQSPHSPSSELTGQPCSEKETPNSLECLQNSKDSTNNNEESKQNSEEVFEPEVWKFSQRIAISLVERILREQQQYQSDCNCFFSNKLIIIVDVFHLRSMRKPYAHLANEFTFNRYCEIFLDTAIETAIANDTNIDRTSKRIGKHLITKLHQQFEKPLLDSDTIQIASNSCNQQAITSLLSNISEIHSRRKEQQSLESQQERLRQLQIEADTAHTQENMQHQLDLKLREVISEFAKSNAKSNSLGKTLALLKKLYQNIASSINTSCEQTFDPKLRHQYESFHLPLSFEDLLKSLTVQIQAAKYSVETHARIFKGIAELLFSS